METLLEQVEHTALLMAQESQLDDEGIFNLLIRDGFTEILATRLNVFVPHAFGRILLQAKQAPKFSADFVLERSDGLRVKVRFDREPIMSIATELASDWMSSEGHDFMLVANRSSEVNAAKQVCEWEAGPSPIEFCEPVIPGIDPCEYGLYLKPWWRFW